MGCGEKSIDISVPIAGVPGVQSPLWTLHLIRYNSRTGRWYVMNLAKIKTTEDFHTQRNFISIRRREFLLRKCVKFTMDIKKPRMILSFQILPRRASQRHCSPRSIRFCTNQRNNKCHFIALKMISSEIDIWGFVHRVRIWWALSMHEKYSLVTFGEVWKCKFQSDSLMCGLPLKSTIHYI